MPVDPSGDRFSAYLARNWDDETAGNALDLRLDAGELAPGAGDNGGEANAGSGTAPREGFRANQMMQGVGPNSATSTIGADVSGEGALSLADVMASVYRSYPEILQARQQAEVAGGNYLSSWGSYDTKAYSHALAEPTGFYENYRTGLGVARQLWWGGYVAAGYRNGRGEFQPWYKERQTDEAGEFKIGIIQPLLRGRGFDPQRLAVFRNLVETQLVSPGIQLAILESSRDAALVYWDWVAAGATLRAQTSLLNLAVTRGEQLAVLLDAEKIPEIAVVLNRQLVAERKAKRIEVEQKYRASGFKLSLFLRDGAGQPIVADDQWLPLRFPPVQSPSMINPALEVQDALARRPEIEILELQIRQLQYDRRLACNDMLPQFDFITEASQDMGEQASSSIDDKGEFELVIGFQSDVPIQRRKARGKIQSTNGKIVQTNQKLEFVRNKIQAELFAARNRLELATQIVNQSEKALETARDSLSRYRDGFNEGKTDLIVLNLVETKATETEIKLIEARRDWFLAVAALQYALGLDPLEQAEIVSAGRMTGTEIVVPQQP